MYSSISRKVMHVIGAILSMNLSYFFERLEFPDEILNYNSRPDHRCEAKAYRSNYSHRSVRAAR